MSSNYKAPAALAALAITALLLTLTAHESRALAHAPHAGLDFSMAADMDGNTVDDCGTAAGQPTTCTAALHAPFRVREYLDSLANILAFRAVRLHFGFGPSVSPAGPPHSMWPGSAWDYFNPTGDAMNRLDDVLAVLQQYFVDEGEPGYSVETDRSAFGPNGWNVGPPNGRQRIDDVVAALNSYLHDCS